MVERDEIASGEDLAMVIDFTADLHIRREGAGLMFGSRAEDLAGSRPTSGAGCR